MKLCQLIRKEFLLLPIVLQQTIDSNFGVLALLGIFRNWFECPKGHCGKLPSAPSLQLFGLVLLASE